MVLLREGGVCQSEFIIFTGSNLTTKEGNCGSTSHINVGIKVLSIGQKLNTDIYVYICE